MNVDLLLHVQKEQGDMTNIIFNLNDALNALATGHTNVAVDRVRRVLTIVQRRHADNIPKE